MYSVEQINHIIYNNRTFEGVVKNFIPELKFDDLYLLLEIEKQMKFVNKLINKDFSIIIDKEKLDLNLPDIKIYPNQLENIKISSRNFSDEELQLINSKKLPNEIIEQYDISPISQFKNNFEILEILGVTTHPILTKLIGNGISDGLLVPLYKDGKLINIVSRKTNNITRLKYGITVPSLHLWGDDIIENDEIWLCEGTFDVMAIRYNNKRCVSSCACSLSDYQYFTIIKNKPKLVNIFADNDTSGYRSALKSKKIFGLNNIECRIYSSKFGKDAAEHFFELQLDWNDVTELKITSEMINREDKNFDFLKYLENRKF